MPIELPMLGVDFSEVDVFRELRGEHLRGVGPALRCFRYSDGEVLFREGASEDALIGLVEGRVRVTKQNERGEAIELALLRSGMSVGEMALIDGAPRSATARAVGRVVVIRLSQAAFERLGVEQPVATVLIQRALLRSLSLRLRRTTARYTDAVPAAP